MSSKPVLYLEVARVCSNSSALNGRRENVGQRVESGKRPSVAKASLVSIALSITFAPSFCQPWFEFHSSCCRHEYKFPATIFRPDKNPKDPDNRISTELLSQRTVTGHRSNPSSTYKYPQLRNNRVIARLQKNSNNRQLTSSGWAPGIL